jgi:hypothetical protein
VGKISKSDSEQPEPAETSVPDRYTIQSLGILFDVLRRFDAGDAAGAESGRRGAGSTASSPLETGNSGSAEPGGP